MSIAAETFSYISTLVRKEAAIVLEVGKEYLVEARLLPLARNAGTASVDEYVAGLRRSSDRVQVQKVVDALTTNETSWLRDNEPFQALVSEVVPALMSSKRTSKTLSIWSAACSSGQEPYGIAMQLDDLLRTSGWKLDILATDISLDMLDRAQKGVYSQLEMNRGLPAPMLVKHFTREGASWKIADQLRQAITFKQVNLAQPFPPMPTFDVIFLRNVLIYFDPPTKRAILQRMRQVLAPGGFLFLGGAETTMGIDDSWERVKVGRAFAHCPKVSGAGAAPSVAAASAASASALVTPRSPLTASQNHVNNASASSAAASAAANAAAANRIPTPTRPSTPANSPMGGTRA